MSKIDWTKAPEGAEFYAGRMFRCKGFYYDVDVNKWIASSLKTAELKSLEDYEINPNLSELSKAAEKQGRGTWLYPHRESNVSDGSTASYYQLPEGATELQHLISDRNMNAQDGEMFRAIYRKGRASHSDELRDAKKVLFYAQAEVERLEKLCQKK